MVINTLPIDFCLDHINLTWPDVKWGYRGRWLNENDVIQYALHDLQKNEASDSVIVELAGLLVANSHEVSALLDRVSEAPKDESEVDPPAKWLYLILAWLYEHRDEISDPLGGVESLYAEFDYPSEISGFVRYMPPEDGYEPGAHTPEENIARLFRKWSRYLDDFPRD